MMGMKVKPSALKEIIEDIDEDGSGLLEFGGFLIILLLCTPSPSPISSPTSSPAGEFCQLAAKFLVEEDEEALKKELKEAFRFVCYSCSN